MSKKSLKEGIISKVVMGMFDSIVKGKQSRVKKQLANDPQLKKHYEDFDKSIAKLQSILKKRK